MKTLGLLRWMAGGAVFVTAGLMFGGMASESRMTPVPSRLASHLIKAEAPKYVAAPSTDVEVQSALKFALADQRRRNRSTVKLLSVLNSERQDTAGTNVRLCLSLNRQGRTEPARVVVHHSEKDQWSVTLWAWGACK